jgi:TonB family protein
MPKSVGRRARPGSLVVAILVTVMAQPLIAQRGEVGTGGVNGVVKDSLGIPVVGAMITVGGTTLVAETDERGEFRLAKAAPGETSIRIRRIGYKPDTVRVTVLAGETHPVAITLARLAVELEPLVIFGRRNVAGRFGGFYERLARGMGHFMTREQIDKRNPMNMTDLFRMIPGVRVESRGFSNQAVRFRGARQPPLVWLDGTPLYSGEFDLDSVDPRTFEGIEIYSGPASVPAEFLGNRMMSSTAGTIVLWTRQGELRPKKRKKDELSPAAQIQRMVEARTVFTSTEVDIQAAPDSGDLIRPVYPDSLFDYAVGGKVLVEFVVGAGGDVLMDTFSIVTSTHPAFGEAVRRAVKDQRYRPARRGTNPVQQVVQQPFDFVPDSTALRRRR